MPRSVTFLDIIGVWQGKRRRCTWPGSAAATPTSRASAGLRVPLPAAHLPRRRQGLARDAGEPVRAARRRSTAIEAALKGTPLVPAGQAVTITASVPHGHVAAVHAMAVKLGLPSLLGPACAERDLALALVDLPGGGPGVQAVHAGLVG